MTHTGCCTYGSYLSRAPGSSRSPWLRTSAAAMISRARVASPQIRHPQSAGLARHPRQPSTAPPRLHCLRPSGHRRAGGRGSRRTTGTPRPSPPSLPPRDLPVPADPPPRTPIAISAVQSAAPYADRDAQPPSNKVLIPSSQLSSWNFIQGFVRCHDRLEIRCGTPIGI
ncbi:hypothetical protein DAI22_03g360866 [Oryza sativa Japonica Group]|nr:hypothetical protein DAI22_03g360866 [Oryza sativa Japonica Group]